MSMSASDENAKPRVIDIALQAGVSTATVDRVINKRPGVRRKTVDKVLDAIQRLGASKTRPKVIPSVPAGLTLDVVLAQGAGFANDVLSSELRRYCEQVGFTYRQTLSKRMVPEALRDALEQCLERGTDGIIVQPLDHPIIRDVIARIAAAGIPVICILTDLPASDRIAYVGLDNRAAGRTAGLLMGRLCHGPGAIALFAGGVLYRSHEERETGFRSVMRDSFAQFRVLSTFESNDDPHRTYEMASSLLRKNDDLRGICCVGGGNRGIEKALLECERQLQITYCAFNLTPLTRQGLLAGVFDAVVHQDMERAARQAIDGFVIHLAGKTPSTRTIPIEIMMMENLRQY